MYILLLSGSCTARVPAIKDGIMKIEEKVEDDEKGQDITLNMTGSLNLDIKRQAISKVAY